MVCDSSPQRAHELCRAAHHINIPAHSRGSHTEAYATARVQRGDRKTDVLLLYGSCLILLCQDHICQRNSIVYCGCPTIQTRDLGLALLYEVFTNSKSQWIKPRVSQRHIVTCGERRRERSERLGLLYKTASIAQCCSKSMRTILGWILMR